MRYPVFVGVRALPECIVALPKDADQRDCPIWQARSQPPAPLEFCNFVEIQGYVGLNSAFHGVDRGSNSLGDAKFWYYTER